MGLISKPCRRDLDLIRKIRNDFAHDPELISFETQSIRNRSKSLSFSYHLNDANPRDHFTAAALGVLGQIHTVTLTTTPHSKRPDDSPSKEQKEMHRAQIEMLAKEMNNKNEGD